MPRVAIIGAGLIGRSWAIVFARAGWDVSLYDASRDQGQRAVAAIEVGLRGLAEHGLVGDAPGAAARVRVAEDLTSAIDGVDFVQENLPEVLAQKQAIFRELDRLAAPPIVLASSTSAIVASQFTADLAGRARCLVGHPVNPPHLVPLVEVVGAPFTSPDAVRRAQDVYQTIGQVPILVRAEVDGFILNRLQGALLAEAFRLVAEGYVSPQDLDKTVKHGLGLRWCFMGPFETIELNAPGGIPDYCARYGEGYKRRQAAAAPPEVFEAAHLEQLLRAWGNPMSADRLEARTRWRDHRLAALRAHKDAQADG
jgi:3-hydroxyacyl-CoA dehydrogenase